jgi:signal transduction histidine kinase
MRRWLGKSPLFPDGKKGLKALKIVTIVAPVLFVILLELLRRNVFEETLPMIWGTLSLLIIVMVAAFFFSKLVFAIINRLQEENVRRMRELTTLSEVYETVDEFYNLNALLNRSMDKLIQITASDSGELYLFDEQSRELVHSLHGGLLDEVFKRETQLQLKEWLISEGARLNQQVIMENLKNFQSRPIASLADAGVRSLAIVPLKSSSGTIGVVCLFSLKPDHFKLNEASLLLSIGYRIAVAVEKARLYEKVQAVAVLEERERISTELHDGLAQVLSYVITKSQAVRQLLRKMTVATDYLEELENIAQEVYTDTREAILGLRTAISGDKSMVSALREYAARFNQMHGIKTELMVGDHIIPSLSPQIELQAIRIVQEALSNIRKHAEATRATIRIAAGDDGVIIVIEDDGKGFNIDKSEKGDWTKFGLRNMKERADSINGSLFIESKPEIGTKVTLKIPLTSNQDAVKEGEKIESTSS